MGKSGWRNCNLRTQFERIVKNSGLKKWPRLFHNLRSSRQTELAEVFPSHMLCAWLGNSEDIAKKHYYQVTDAHFAAAIGQPAPTSAPPDVAAPATSKSDADFDAPTAPISTRHRPARNRTTRLEPSTAQGVMRCPASTCRTLQKPQGGWGGIRTHERLSPLPVFKTGAFNRSATHPRPAAAS